jgi:hypothetical protein
LIPFCENPKFLGVVFDKTLNFSRHYENLRMRASKRLNMIKIFSHRSWGLNSRTLKCIYTALVGSLFDYSLFSVANVRKSPLQKLQVIQNSAFRRIHHLPPRTRVAEILEISLMLKVKDRMTSLGCRYIAKAMQTNPLIQQMIAEFWNTRAKYTWFVGSPFAVIIPLLAIAKSIYIYCSFTALYIYLMAICTNEVCWGMNRGRLRPLLRTLDLLIYETCVQNPGPLTLSIYEAE